METNITERVGQGVQKGAEKIRGLGIGLEEYGGVRRLKKEAVAAQKKAKAAAELYLVRRVRRDRSLVGTPLMDSDGFCLAGRSFSVTHGGHSGERVESMAGRAFVRLIDGQTTDGDLTLFGDLLQKNGIDLRDRPPSVNYFTPDTQLLSQQAWFFGEERGRLIGVAIDYDTGSGVPKKIGMYENQFLPEGVSGNKIYPLRKSA